MDNQILPPPHDWREDSPFLGTLAYMIEDTIYSVHDMALEDVFLCALALIYLFLVAAIS